MSRTKRVNDSLLLVEPLIQEPMCIFLLRGFWSLLWNEVSSWRAAGRGEQSEEDQTPQVRTAEGWLADGASHWLAPEHPSCLLGRMWSDHILSSVWSLLAGHLAQKASQHLRHYQTHQRSQTY